LPAGLSIQYSYAALPEAKLRDFPTTEIPAMTNLLIASTIWALSFGIIKYFLTDLPPLFVSAARLLTTFLIFAPFLTIRKLHKSDAAALALTGAVQYGLMYIFYISSFRYLLAAQVALFTVFTPLYVVLLDSHAEGKYNGRFFLSALLAVCGTIAVMRFSGGDLRGFILVQLSNICFAWGQLRYRTIASGLPSCGDTTLFAWVSAGACAAAMLPALAGSIPHFTARQALWLLYLGAVPSGLCFFLWAKGSKTVNAGTLAALNNLKIPLGAAAAVMLFGERPGWARFTLAITAIAAATLLSGRNNGNKA